MKIEFYVKVANALFEDNKTMRSGMFSEYEDARNFSSEIFGQMLAGGYKSVPRSESYPTLQEQAQRYSVVICAVCIDNCGDIIAEKIVRQSAYLEKQ